LTLYIKFIKINNTIFFLRNKTVSSRDDYPQNNFKNENKSYQEEITLTKIKNQNKSHREVTTFKVVKTNTISSGDDYHFN
jgi:hypothetical protein